MLKALKKTSSWSSVFTPVTTWTNILRGLSILLLHQIVIIAAQTVQLSVWVKAAPDGCASLGLLQSSWPPPAGNTSPCCCCSFLKQYSKGKRWMSNNRELGSNEQTWLNTVGGIKESHRGCKVVGVFFQLNYILLYEIIISILFNYY